ncbi:MAG: ligase-associated DNA damage response DEXH box helicase [Rhodospirillaceae bacterium]|nr:ligase-associated DNA damage response DEXH box helicase [Rhodospirillaceae bacterium]
MARPLPSMNSELPEPFAAWFAARGWHPHPHQTAMLAAAQQGQSVLLIAPTGGGKTLSGFLPSLIDLVQRPRSGLHTLYISPLKALAVDVRRNLETPVVEMGLGILTDTRTGDTSMTRKAQQRRRPPQILMTTPESLALMLSHADAAKTFAALACVIVDEVHALAGNKRGDLLALGLARLARLAPAARRVGLSATVAFPDLLARWMGAGTRVIAAAAGPKPDVQILRARDRMPWSGHMGLYAVPEVYAAIKAHTTTLVFVNTRATAELVFHQLWRINDDNLPIALHHGSLAKDQRLKVEAAMAAGRLRAVVATSSLDLGIDWGAVDLVVQMGAPKGISRLIQRVGRSNHRFDAPSKALLVPGNRFEALECAVATEAIADGVLDGDAPRPGALDVLCQHILGVACAGPFTPDDLFAEVTSAAPYAQLPRKDFDDALAFVATGGYALRAYERFAKLVPDSQGRVHVRGPRIARQYRMNVGVIVGAETIRVRLRGGRFLGEVEEYFILGLAPKDTFVFAGQVLRFERMVDTYAEVSRATGDEPKVPAYVGGRLPISSALAVRLQRLLNAPARWRDLAPDVREWLDAQRARSVLPKPGSLLVETFPRGGRHFLVAYGFAGRNAHQTLGMLLAKRMMRLKLKPVGFVANDYAIAVWSLEPPTDVAALFDQDILGDDLEEWITESNMLKRLFRNVAVIAGQIERRHPGAEKTGRQVTVNSDLIYDVLRKHEPNHLLLRATRSDAAGGLIDLSRLAGLLQGVAGRIVHRPLTKVSPLAVPVLLDIGKEAMGPALLDDFLDDAAAGLIRDAMG